MNNNNERLQAETKRRYWWDVYCNGVRHIRGDSKMAGKYMLLCALVATVVCVAIMQSRMDGVLSVFNPFVYGTYIVAGVVACVAAVIPFGYIRHSWDYYDDFTRAGIYNSAREAPLLESVTQDGKILRLTFTIKGYPLEQWEAARTVIESALNVTIISIAQGSSNRLFRLSVVPGRNLLNSNIPWSDTYIDADVTKIVLGINAAGVPVSIDLGKIPHWLLAAATGMGKTKLVQLILHQLTIKGYDIYLADYKGVDFGVKYRQQGHYADNDTALAAMLDTVLEELNKRRAVFSSIGCANIDEYIRMTGKILPRTMVLLDETSMILDATGRDKDGKATISSLTNKLLQIGRLGRAFGIYLLVATQRTDVNSVPGSLKAQLDGRICGHTADAQSSIVILDDGSASKLPATPGRYIIRNGSGVDEIIQAYNYHQ